MPIRGGRWQVRKVREENFPWFAFTAGKAKKYNFRFETQYQAVTWARFVAICYSQGKGDPSSLQMILLAGVFKVMRTVRKYQLDALRNHGTLTRQSLKR